MKITCCLMIRSIQLILLICFILHLNQRLMMNRQKKSKAHLKRIQSRLNRVWQKVPLKRTEMKLLNISLSQHLRQAMNLKLRIQVNMFKLRIIKLMMTSLSRLNQRLMKLQQLILRANRMKSLKRMKRILQGMTQ